MRFALLVLLCVALVGCASVGSESQRYAELRLGPDGRSQLHICSDVWRGVFTPDGFGGHGHNVHFWAVLKGAGPEYKDPIFHENSPSPPREHKGVIVIDRKKMIAVISLDRIIPTEAPKDQFEPGAKSGPSTANGTYPLRIKKASKSWELMPE